MGDPFIGERVCGVVWPQPRGGEKAAVGGLKWPSRASFIGCGVSAPGREGKRRGARLEANRFAVHRF